MLNLLNKVKNYWKVKTFNAQEPKWSRILLSEIRLVLIHGFTAIYCYSFGWLASDPNATLQILFAGCFVCAISFLIKKRQRPTLVAEAFNCSKNEKFQF